MMLLKRLMAACAITLSMALPGAAASIIVDGSFESGALAPNWSTQNSPRVTTDEAFDGIYSVESFASDFIRQDFAAVATSAITEVSVAVKRLGGQFNQYWFYYADNTEESFLINNIGNSDDWDVFDLTSNLAVGKDLVGFGIFGTSPGPSYIDQVVINTDMNAVPLPASLPLLAAGFGGLFVLRRRKRA